MTSTIFQTKTARFLPMRFAFALLGALPVAGLARAKDIRDLDNAVGVIAREGYCDQPYLVQAKNGE